MILGVMHRQLEYIDCSLAWSACPVLVDLLCHEPPLCCGATIRCKRLILFKCLVHKLNSNCEAQRASKNLIKIVDDRVKSQNNACAI
jgi:hypothetical protein